MEPFVSSDYSLVHGIKDYSEVRGEILHLVEEMRAKERLLRRTIVDEVSFLEHSSLPPRGGSTGPFLAFHYDRGHVLFPEHPETIVAFVALYFPNWHPPGDATTRIVPLTRLLANGGCGDCETVEKRLYDYALSHGSSWDWDTTSGGRVSCFARVLDALAANHRLTNFKETPKDRWYVASRGGNEFDGYDDEVKFYESFGLDIQSAQTCIKLRPGDLLVLNNIATIHGRRGVRQRGEIDQYLLGKHNVPIQESAGIRSWLVDLLSNGCRDLPDSTNRSSTSSGAS